MEVVLPLLTSTMLHVVLVYLVLCLKVFNLIIFFPTVSFLFQFILSLYTFIFITKALEFAE